MPPVVIAGGLAAAGAVGGAVIGSNAAKSAAKGAERSANAQIANSNANRDYQYNLNAPTIAQGAKASDLYAGFLGAGGGDDYASYVQSNPDLLAAFQQEQQNPQSQFKTLADFGKFHYDKFGQAEGRALPTTSSDGGSAQALEAFRGSTGYKDLLKQGLGAVNSQAYATGMGDSGATLKALQDRGTAIADSSANQWLGGLGNLMSAGGQARGLVAGIGANTVNATNQATQSASDASGNAKMASAGMINSGIQSLLNAGAFAYGSSYGGKR